MLRKFDMNIFHICLPLLPDIDTLPWEIQKVSFSFFFGYYFIIVVPCGRWNWLSVQHMKMNRLFFSAVYILGLLIDLLQPQSSVTEKDDGMYYSAWLLS